MSKTRAGKVALGLKARTGRAVLVVLERDASGPTLLERSEFKTHVPGEMAAYHQAEGLLPEAARASVARSIATAHRLAEDAIRAAVQRLRAAGHEVAGGAVLLGPGMPAWSAEEILAVHVRMHQAEGELFRNVLAAGVKACGLALLELPEKTALDAAAASLGWPRGELEAVIAGLGKAAGAPWGKDQKEACAAALAALAAAG
jgi:hypothetical protein